MMEYLSYNDFDISAITNEVNQWKAAGYYADFDLSSKSQGKVMMVLENLAEADGSLAYFEFHKFGMKRFLGHKVRWIVQMYSSQVAGGEITRHGCLSANTLVAVIFEGHRDLKHGFLSVCDFDLALSAILGD